jgi:hypothetical protein
VTVANPTGRAIDGTASTLRAGQYYPVPPGSPSTSNGLGNGTLRVAPYYIASRVQFVRLGAEITVVGDVGSVLRLGIYADDGNGYPGALVLDAGTIPADAVAVAEIVIALTLNPGLYWFGGAVQAAAVTQPTVRTVSAAAASPVVTVGSAGPVAGLQTAGYTMGGIAGALPSPFANNGGASGSTPRVLYRVA